MADYYSILEKTIAGLPSNTPAVRDAVYAKARTAIETQLRNMNPAPSEEAITSQLGLLEKAIVQIGANYDAPSMPIEPEPTLEPVESIAETPVEPVVEETIIPEAQPEPEYVQQAALEPLPETPVEPLPTPPIPETIVEETPQAPLPPLPNEGAELADNVIERAENLVQAIPPATVGMDELVAETEIPPANLEAPVLSAEPTIAYNDTIEQGSSTTDTLGPLLVAKPLAGSQDVSSYDDDFEEKKSSGFLGGLIKLLIVLGLIGGAGFAVWKNKDALSQQVSNFTDGNVSFGSKDANDVTQLEQSAQTEEVPAVQPEPEVVPEPIIEPTPEPEPEVAIVPEPEPESTELEIVEPEIIETEVVQPETTEPEVVEPEAEVVQEETTPAQTGQNGVIPIGEVAYLYEEGSAGSGATRTSAGVTWDLAQESIQDGLPAEPVILGKMDVAERNLSLDIKINRNVDPAISASHIIEIIFNLPPDFNGKGVESIARFVMKETEEAPGEPLVAVPFKASEGRFLIALDNLPQALSINTALLRDASWIDIPLVYGTGKRALLTLEKGGTGERVFTEAFRDWQNR